jgi:GNAT superfamily N-acetyltransferase
MICIESYSDKYQQQIANLITGIQHNEFQIPITLAEQPDLQNIPGFYQTNNGGFWVATVDGIVVGTIALLDIDNGKGALRKMFVDANYRGKELGVAQQLLNALLGWAKEKGFREILLGTTAKFIAAQRFYEKNGFVELEQSLLPSGFPVMKVDVKFYRYEIGD